MVPFILSIKFYFWKLTFERYIQGHHFRALQLIASCNWWFQYFDVRNVALELSAVESRFSHSLHFSTCAFTTCEHRFLICLSVDWHTSSSQRYCRIIYCECIWWICSTRVTSGIVSPNAASGYNPWKSGSMAGSGNDSNRTSYLNSDMDSIRNEWVTSALKQLTNVFIRHIIVSVPFSICVTLCDDY